MQGSSIAGLHVRSRRPCQCQEQKHFSPLGNKLYFHVNSSRINSIVLTPNIATLFRVCKPRIRWTKQQYNTVNRIL